MSSAAALCSLLFATAACLVAGGRISEGRVKMLAGEDTGVEEAREVTNASLLTHWRLFGKEGPKVTDVSQGSLGNCYFLAVLASIANVHPEIIVKSFVMRGQTSRQGRTVYQVSFLLDGVETIVAMDEKVPVRSLKTRTTKGSFFFADTNDGDDVWPILMEKGWAKLFGSYLATVAGWTQEAFKALTQAPVHGYMPRYGVSDRHYWPKPDQLWDIMKEALDNNFPMAAASTKNSVGTVAGHAFAVIGLSESSRGSRAVEVYNPWAANRYEGMLKHKSHQMQGAYFLTFEEFQEAFSHVDVAHIRKNYRVNYLDIPVGEPTALKFSIRNRGPFAVQLEWPTDRFVNVHGCRLDPNYVRLMVRKVGGHDWVAGFRPSTHSNMRLELNERGTYLLYAHVSFSGAPVVTWAAVNVYAGEDVDFVELKPALDVGREIIIGFPCEFLVKPGVVSWFDDIYEPVPFPVGGSPAWKKRNSKKVIWVDEDGRLTRAPSLDQLDSRLPGYNFEKLECRQSVSSEADPEDKPEPAEDVIPSGCGFRLGDHVLYRHGDVWTCSEINAFYANEEEVEVEVRFHNTEREYLRCTSASLLRVTQCPWQEQDQVEVYQYGRWVSDQVEEVGCGEVVLSKSGTVECGAGLRYPHGCPVYDGEKVIVWNKRVEQWHFAEVAHVVGDQATVKYRGGFKALPCGDRDRLRKLSRCDKLIHDQLSRFSKLNNVDEILTEGRDSQFPPNLFSIGPPSSDCGDSADGSGPKDCDQFNTWGAISDVLL